jgi:hypothetical protein
VTKLQTSVRIGLVLLVVAGCAQQPLRNGAPPVTRAARYGVSPGFLRVAANYGYEPKVINGTVMFCRYEESLGSHIDQTYCYNTARMKLQLEREGLWGSYAQRALEKPSIGCYYSGVKCGS